jgi:hypothetical protein
LGLFYYHYDGLGSVVALSDASGKVDFADFVDFALLDSCCIEVF